MLRGTELEPAARAAYERLTRLTMKPLVLVRLKSHRSDHPQQTSTTLT